MKSKTSCFDPATARMEIRRFYPLLILYSVLLAVAAAMFLLPGRSTAYTHARTMHDFMKTMTIVNFGYAFVLSQLLFGDLYTPRLCYAIHALPITRGAFFGTQIVLGLAASLIPNSILAAVMCAYLRGVKVTALIWLAASELQFLCFFGTGCISAVCAGNRFGMMLLGGIVNFLAVLVYWFASQIYLPMLFGLDKSFSALLKFCPSVVFLDQGYMDFFTVQSGGQYHAIELDHISLSADWVYYLLYGLFGIACIWGAMVLYRKRQLECAGDLLAFPRMKPAFLVLYTLTVGGFFHLFGFGLDFIFSRGLFFVGLIVGHYTGLMLLKRQAQVFTRKALAPLAALIGVILVSMALTGLDVLGVTRKIPEVQDVAEAYIAAYHYEYRDADRADVEAAIAIHRSLLQEHETREKERSLLSRMFGAADRTQENGTVFFLGEHHETSPFTITYKLKDGSTLIRTYRVGEMDEAFEALRTHFSKPELALGYSAEAIRSMEDKMISVTLVCEHARVGDKAEYWDTEYTVITDTAQIKELMEAVLADCAEGHAAQEWIFRTGMDYLEFACMPDADIQFPAAKDEIAVEVPASTIEVSDSLHITLRPNPDSENTYRWLMENGYHAAPEE